MIRHLCLLTVVSLLFIHCSDGLGTNFRKIKELLNKDLKFEHGINIQDFSAFEHYIKQKLDHFNPLDKATYNQRYFVNDQFFKKPDGPVFIFIGGESAISLNAVRSGFIVQAAQKLGALVFAVEHRYYGKSLNNDSLELENLKYLSSQQALADLAHFHQVVSETYKLGKNNKWVSFGGSYPGSLSAWFRLKYPHLTVGAVSSSSPVESIVDFQDYNNVVATSLGTELVGGSKECVDNIKSSFIKVDEMLDDKEFEKLGKDFNVCSPLTDNVYDLYTFASNTADLFMGTVQYNNIRQNAPFSIKKICKEMTETPDAYQNLVNLYQHLSRYEEKCLSVSWSEFINYLKNESVDFTKMERQWTYQTCAQFGYYQACERQTDCIFSKYNTLTPNLEMCRSIFNINPSSIYENVEFTNSFYGSNDPKGSNILFVNGLIDPWHALSVLKNLTDTENAIVIPGTAHCADMHDAQDSDPEVLVKAREAIMDKIVTWLDVKPQKSMFRLPPRYRFIDNNKEAGSKL